MNFGRLSREDRQKLYAKKMTELQRRWGNPIDDDWSALTDWPDENLNKGIKDTIGQLRFEKFYDGANKLIHYSIKAFILLGIIGLLLFGIRQLFG
ncbi:MAG: hypothetical protein AAB517_01175 [Patescibacteria group bacterium]